MPRVAKWDDQCDWRREFAAFRCNINGEIPTPSEPARSEPQGSLIEM